MTVLAIPSALNNANFTSGAGSFTLPAAKTTIDGACTVNLTGATLVDGGGTVGLFNVRDGGILTLLGGDFELTTQTSGLIAIATGANGKIYITSTVSNGIPIFVTGTASSILSLVQLRGVSATGLKIGVEIIGSIDIDSSTLLGAVTPIDPAPVGVHFRQDAAKTQLWVPGTYVSVTNSTVTGFKSNAGAGFLQGDAILVESNCESVFVNNCILGHNSDSGGLDSKANWGTIQNSTIYSDGGRGIAWHTNGPGDATHPGGGQSINNRIIVNSATLADGTQCYAYVAAGTFKTQSDIVTLPSGAKNTHGTVTLTQGSGALGSYPRVGHTDHYDLVTPAGVAITGPDVMDTVTGNTATVAYHVTPPAVGALQIVARKRYGQGVDVTGFKDTVAKVAVVGDLGGLTTDPVALFAKDYFNDSTCQMLLCPADEVYPGGNSTDWTTFPFAGLVLRADGTQFFYPGTGHHEWGKSGASGVTGTVVTPAGGLKPYMDSVRATPKLQYGDGLWYYRLDNLVTAGWVIIVLSGTMNDGSNIITGAGLPLVPLDSASTQYNWLETQLIDIRAKGLSVLAMWSDPRWATTDSSHSQEPNVGPFWDLLSTYVPDKCVVVNGHKHNYERFAKVGVNGFVSQTGIAQFVVGTGGQSHYAFTGTPKTGSLVRDATHYGILELTLSAGSCDFAFIDAADKVTILDNGSIDTGGGSGTGKTGTVTVVTMSPTSPASSGATETLTATVTPATATGTVQFYDGGTAIGAVQTTDGTTGVVSITRVLGDGSHSITARFTADVAGNFNNSTSAIVAYDVSTGATATTISLAVSPAGSSTPGSTETLTATVVPSTAVGAVRFYQNGTAIGADIPLSGGSAVKSTVLPTGASIVLDADFIPTNPATWAASNAANISYRVQASGTIGVIWGSSSKVPDATAPAEVASYKQQTNDAALFSYIQNEYNTLVAKTHSYNLRHTYSGTKIPATFGASSASVNPGKGAHTLLNTKADCLDVINGLQDSNIIGLTTSSPAASTGWYTYLAFNHEPEGFDLHSTPANWNAAFAHFCKVVLDNRGTRHVYPCHVVQAYDWQASAAANRAGPQWNCSQNLADLGVDITQVIFAPDGYSSDPAGKSVADEFLKPFQDAKSWGFTRFGLSEVACKSYTSADRSATSQWLTDLSNFATTWNMDYIAWYGSDIGGAAGPEGWYLYGDANKKQFANAANAGRHP